MAKMEVETYKQVRQEQTEAFGHPAMNDDLLFWTMCQLRRTARTIDLLQIGTGIPREKREIRLESAIPDITADVIENVLKARNYQFPIWHQKRAPHWFDEEA